MDLEVLISCMHQKDLEIVRRSRITTDALVINQADSQAVEEIRQGSQRIRMITTTERGLSRSRNMALEHAQGEICLLCDDDEIFKERYEAMIRQAFGRLPDADIIAFDVENKVTRLKPCPQKVGRLKSLKLSSCQLAFRRRAVLEKGIRFDVLMGAGSGNGCGEENKFLLDCLRAGLRIYYVPIQIAALDTKASTWFSGFDALFFYQRGAATRYMLGLWPAIAYGIYYIIAKRNLYRSTISSREALKALVMGMRDNRIYRQKRKGKHD